MRVFRTGNSRTRALPRFVLIRSHPLLPYSWPSLFRIPTHDLPGTPNSYTFPPFSLVLAVNSLAAAAPPPHLPIAIDIDVHVFLRSLWRS